MKPKPSDCRLLGDVVDSRSAPDRAALHARLTEALIQTDRACPSRSGLEVTVGDEFQASYATLGQAIDAALRLRLLLHPAIDVRVGIGRGDVVDLDAARGLQDGPGWWAARAAIEQVENLAGTPALRTLRTAYRDPGDPQWELAVNAALQCRDQVVGSMPERPVRILRHLLEGVSQSEIASHEGISPSAVSQQVRGHGIGAILHAHHGLKELS